MTTPPCPHRPPCPGCPRYGERGIPARARERLAEFAARHGAPPPSVVDAVPWGSRHRARLMVRGRTRTPKIGLFQKGTHRIVDIPHCRIHHPLVNRVADAVRTAAAEAGVSAYADAPHRGALRAIQVVVERSAERAQVVLVENAETPGPVADLAPRLREWLGDALQSLWWNGNPARTNAILGPAWRHLSGPESVREHVGGCAVHYPPGAFGQSQPQLAQAIAVGARAAVPDGAHVVEYHAGCGPVGLGLLARCASVTFVERSAEALHGLALSLAERPEAERARAEVLPGAAAEHAARVRDADAVILDPPRQGVEPALLEALGAAPPDRLVWIACGLDAFLEQAAALLARTPLRLRALEAHALFPFADHVETLAHFERSPGAPAR